jgi:CheY-like chemotaxis protein
MPRAQRIRSPLLSLQDIMVHSLPSDLAAAESMRQCVHDARNALAAISSAGEVLSRVEQPHALAREAGVVVQRQARHLSARIAELLGMLQPADAPCRVLLVSDDARLLVIAGRMLETSGCTVDFCANSEEALAAMQHRKHSIVVVDVRTSRGNGLGLAQRARSSGFDGRIVAVWGSQLPSHHQVEDGLAGFDAVLTRNFDPASLQTALGGG